MRVFNVLRGLVLKLALVLAVFAAVGAAIWFSQPELDHPDEQKASTQAALTRYPIMLVHGMAGFSEMGRLEYWHRIPEALRAAGAVVVVAQMSAFNTSEERGAQLEEQVKAYLARTGVRQVNLVAHSHGSQAARYVAARHPEWVASVTSVSAPNAGSPVADWFERTSVQLGPHVEAMVAWAFNAWGERLAVWSGHPRPQDALGGMRSLTTAGAADFNRRFPQGAPTTACGEGALEVNHVRYFSWSGVGRMQHAGSPADYLMSLSGLAFSHDDNDGLVSRCSSHWGQVIRDDYPMNHLHAVNQILGLVGPGVDPVSLYVEHARRLREAGL